MHNKVCFLTLHILLFKAIFTVWLSVCLLKTAFLCLKTKQKYFTRGKMHNKVCFLILGVLFVLSDFHCVTVCLSSKNCFFMSQNKTIILYQRQNAKQSLFSHITCTILFTLFSLFDCLSPRSGYVRLNYQIIVDRLSILNFNLQQLRMPPVRQFIVKV